MRGGVKGDDRKAFGRERYRDGGVSYLHREETADSTSGRKKGPILGVPSSLGTFPSALRGKAFSL